MAKKQRTQKLSLADLASANLNLAPEPVEYGLFRYMGDYLSPAETGEKWLLVYWEGQLPFSANASDVMAEVLPAKATINHDRADILTGETRKGKSPDGHPGTYVLHRSWRWQSFRRESYFVVLESEWEHFDPDTIKWVSKAHEYESGHDFGDGFMTL